MAQALITGALYTIGPAERLNHGTVHSAPCRDTVRNGRFESRLHPAQVAKPLAHISELALRQLPRRRTVGAVLEGEQRRHLRKAEPQPLRRVDEPHPVDVCRPVLADSTWLPLRL